MDWFGFGFACGLIVTSFAFVVAVVYATHKGGRS